MATTCTADDTSKHWKQRAGWKRPLLEVLILGRDDGNNDRRPILNLVRVLVLWLTAVMSLVYFAGDSPVKITSIKCELDSLHASEAWDGGLAE